MRQEAQLFKALSDENRLIMVCLILKKGELCVCDFEGGMGISQSRSSRHLQYLSNVGLIESRREAVWVYYRIAPKLTRLQKEVIKAVQTLFDKPAIKEAEIKVNKWLETKKCSPPTKNSKGTKI